MIWIVLCHDHANPNWGGGGGGWNSRVKGYTDHEWVVRLGWLSQIGPLDRLIQMTTWLGVGTGKGGSQEWIWVICYGWLVVVASGFNGWLCDWWFACMIGVCGYGCLVIRIVVWLWEWVFHGCGYVFCGGSFFNRLKLFIFF